MAQNHDDAESQLVSTVERIVAERLENQQAGHGMDHVLRVLRMARDIQTQVGGNRTIVELAALLHDVGDAKFHQGEERSGQYSREILEGLEVRPDWIECIVAIVDTIPFRKQIDSSQLSLEGKIVQDADRLDALGAIGIVRTIEYGAVMEQPFFVPDFEQRNIKTGIGHFHKKLFKLRGMLNTEPAKRIAQDREKFMREFLTRFIDESAFDESANA